MKIKGTRGHLPLIGLLIGLAASSAHAAVIITAKEEGGDVVIDALGTLNTAGLQQWSSTSGIAFVDPAGGQVRLGSAPGLIRLWRNQTGPTSFGTAGITAASSSSGPSFGLGNNGEWMYLPDGFVSGSTIDSGAVFTGATLASLGLTEGTYVWTWSSDTITLNVVPEPGSYALLLAGLGIAGLVRRRRGC